MVDNVTLMCDIRFLIENAMPRARGRIRLNIGPPSIVTWETKTAWHQSSHLARPGLFGSDELPIAL